MSVYIVYTNTLIHVYVFTVNSTLGLRRNFNAEFEKKKEGKTLQVKKKKIRGIKRMKRKRKGDRNKNPFMINLSVYVRTINYAYKKK